MYLKPISLCITLVLSALMAFAQTDGWDTKLLDTGQDEAYLSDSEKQLILLLNEVRTNPAKFAHRYLEQRKNESSDALECYEELLKTPPRQILKPSKALSLAAKDHAVDMGRSGKVGHVSTHGEDGATRVKRYGIFTGPYTGPWECCSYGFSDPLGIILQLLIDENVPNRGHRKNIMETNVNFVGVSIQPHKTYRYNCVIDFADSIKDK